MAAYVLRDIIDQGRSLDKTLATESAKLNPQHRPLLQELAYGGCRRYHYLDGVLSTLLQKPVGNKNRIVHFLMIVGLYQLVFTRIPDHAAVDQTVKALGASKQSWASGLVNGVLRQYIRWRDAYQSEHRAKLIVPGLSASQSAGMPQFIFEQIQQSWPKQAAAIIEASNQKPPMTLRVNCQQTTRADYLELLSRNQLEAVATQDSATGIMLAQAVAVERLPMFTQGWVSVQDESAQLCTELMALSPAMRVLDGCAAPGGKTCALLESEPAINLTAVDLPERVIGITQNLARIGLQATVYGSRLQDLDDWWDGQKWHRILLDLPCSGTGVIRRHPDIQHRRLPGDLERFAGQQLELLQAVWPTLADDGMILYATCSIMPIENQQVVERFVDSCRDAVVKPIKMALGQPQSAGQQRLPSARQGDGFYYCLLQKRLH